MCDRLTQPAGQGQDASHSIGTLSFGTSLAGSTGLCVAASHRADPESCRHFDACASTQRIPALRIAAGVNRSREYCSLKLQGVPSFVNPRAR